MFEKEIQFISDFTLNKIKKLGPFFTFEKLFSAGIHPAIVQYISAELDYLIYEDRKKLLTNSVFDYSGGSIAKYFLAIGQEIKKSKKVSYEDVKNLVVQAVSFNINFTARPKWSITRIAFDNEEYRTIEEVNLLLNYIYYYDYIRNIVKAYVQKKNLVNLSAQEFNLVLNKLDKEIFAERPHDLIDNALFAMADFASIGAVNKKNVHISSVELFLKEKNLIDYLFKIRRAMPQEAKQKYNIDDIRKVMYAAEKESQPVLTPPAEEDESQEENINRDADEIIIETSEDVSELNGDEIHELETEQDIYIEEETPASAEENDEDDELVLDLPDDEETPGIDELDEMLDELKSSYSEVEIEPVKEDQNFASIYEKELEAMEEDESSSDEAEEYTDEEPSDEPAGLRNELEFDSEELEEDENLDEEELDFEVPDEEDDDKLYGFDDEHETFKSERDVINQGPKPEFKRVEEDDEHPGYDFEELEEDEKPAKSSKKGGRTKDIFNYLSDREIDKIIENIFNDDRDDFATTMEKISECSTYDEATEILKGVFLTYRVNPYSRDAVTLTGAVSNYFEQN